MTFPTPTPSRSQDQDTFDSAIEAFFVYLPTFENNMEALAAAMNLNSTTDTSASSVAIGTGAKTFTVSASKSFQPGMWLVIADTAAPTTNAMFAQVTSYSGTTLLVNSYAIMGSGTKTAWVISQSAPAALEGLYALVAGAATQVFSVAAAVAAAHAVRKDQVHITSESPAFSAYQSTLQSVATATFTKVQLQTEEFDTNSYFDNATNYRFTPLIAGYYQVNFSVRFSADAPNVVASIYKNGARFKDGFTDVSTAENTRNGGAALIFLNGTTDYIELYCYQASGGNLDTTAAVNATYFQASLARAA